MAGMTAAIVGVQARSQDDGPYPRLQPEFGGRGQVRPTECARAVAIDSETRLSPNIPRLDIPGRLASGDAAQFASNEARARLRLTPRAVLPCERRNIIRDTGLGNQKLGTRAGLNTGGTLL